MNFEQKSKTGGINMLKTKKMIAIALAIGLACWFGIFSGKISFAGETGGSVRNYDDSYGVEHRVIDHPYLDVKVWVDKGEGAIYHPGEDVKAYFQTSRDCYVVIYDIDTRGYVHLLYPADQEDDSYVEGGRVYRIPDRFDDYDLTVDGPDGVEYIQAVASLEPIDFPNFPGASSDDEEIYAYKLEGEDPFEFMTDINNEICSDDYASDVCIFNVEYPHPKWYYWPQVVYVDRPVDLMWGGVYFGYPWGVEVWIDGVFYGITPITIPALVIGRHYCSFWFHGCWVWRDWVHVRRGHTIRVWPDCRDRYRFVEERVVEKSYRAEKAKRRRGADETGGLVKPVRSMERERIVRGEAYSIERNKEYKKELPAKRRGAEDRPVPSRLSDDSKSSKLDKSSEPRIIRKSRPSERSTSIPEREIKAKKIRPEGKTLKKIEKNEFSTPKRRSVTPERIHKNENPRPQEKATQIRTGDREQRAAKPTSVRQAPAKADNRGKSGESKGSKPQGKRR
jgi:hypothetical protein